jgi:glycopeptide antibiotics resistance protein
MNEQDSQAVRKYAEKQLKLKREFKQYLFVYAFVVALTIGIWFVMTPGFYFWPGWVIFGMGVAAVLAGLEAYGKLSPKPITQAEIDAEVERLRSKR